MKKGNEKTWLSGVFSSKVKLKLVNSRANTLYRLSEINLTFGRGISFMKINPRNESEVFSQLAKLCSSPGYLHAIALFCFSDNTLRIANELETEEVIKSYSSKHLVKTEISTIIGLACKDKIDDRLPSPNIVQGYIDGTELR